MFWVFFLEVNVGFSLKVRAFSDCSKETSLSLNNNFLVALSTRVFKGNPGLVVPPHEIAEQRG